MDPPQRPPHHQYGDKFLSLVDSPRGHFRQTKEIYGGRLQGQNYSYDVIT